MKNTSQIKTIAFDFDDTLYSGADKVTWKKFLQSSIMDLLSFLSLQELKNIEKDITSRPLSDRKVIQYISKYGLKREDYEQYCKSHISDQNTFQNYMKVSNKVLRQFANNFKLYIVSNSIKTNVLDKCDKLGIDKSLFKDIISNELNEYDSKKVVYKQIIENEKIKPEELLIIGNSFEKDVLPAISIGANGRQIKNANFKFKNFFDKKLKIEKQHLFFTSDTHFGAERTLKLTRRPFKNVKEMDSFIISQWNKAVRKNDIVFHLGDFGNYNILKKLNGKIILILGNYEQKDMQTNFNNSFSLYKKYLKKQGFSAVFEKDYILDMPVFKEQVYLVHKPIECRRDMFNLFGHIHNFCKIKDFGLNVGTDNYNFKPANLEDIIFFKNAIQNIYKDNVFVTKKDLKVNPKS